MGLVFYSVLLLVLASGPYLDGISPSGRWRRSSSTSSWGSRSTMRINFAPRLPPEKIVTPANGQKPPWLILQEYAPPDESSQRSQIPVLNSCFTLVIPTSKDLRKWEMETSPRMRVRTLMTRLRHLWYGILLSRM